MVNDKPCACSEPAVTVTLPPALSGNLILLSAVAKLGTDKLVAEAVTEYLMSRGYDPRRKPKLVFP